MADRYVGVSTDTNDKTIKLGPLLWDGVSPYDPGPDYVLIMESDALDGGYSYPPPEGSGE